MDAERFDAFVRDLTRIGSRRRVLRAIGSGAGALLTLAGVGIAAEPGANPRRRDRGRRHDRGRDAHPTGMAPRRPADGATGRISNGTPVPQGTYTFAAWVRIALSPTSSVSCSGSLIDSAHVLTAAHCVYSRTAGGFLPPSALTVVVGQVDVRSTACAACRKRVTAVAVDPAWVPADTVRPYDVAVLTLDSPVDPAVARPIPLIGANQGGLDAPGREVIAAGWGYTTTGGPTSSVLMQAPLTVVNDASCPADRATIFCTSLTGGRDTCSGDSGAPLFVDAGGLVQVGVVSGGPAGCPSAGSTYGELNVRLSNPDINAFVRAAAASDTTPPTVSATAPPLVKKGQPFTISASASDNTGIDLVELYECNSAAAECDLLDATASAPYDFGLTLFAAGSYVFVVRAIDGAGNYADSDPVSVAVQKKKKKRK